jgi:hypothetical protein
MEEERWVCFVANLRQVLLESAILLIAEAHGLHEDRLCQR